MWISEVLTDESGGIHMGFVDWAGGILPGGWQPVDFTVEGIMDSTFVGILPGGGWRMGPLSVKINRQ